MGVRKAGGVVVPGEVLEVEVEVVVVVVVVVVEVLVLVLVLMEVVVLVVMTVVVVVVVAYVEVQWRGVRGGVVSQGQLPRRRRCAIHCSRSREPPYA